MTYSRAHPIMRRVLATAAWSVVAGGCATSHLDNVTAASPASPDAAIPDAAPIGTALLGEPPLPGEDMRGWPDLGQPSAGGHQHHHGGAKSP